MHGPPRSRPEEVCPVALVKVRAWQAMAAAAAALVGGGMTPASAGSTAGEGRMAPQEYKTECSKPRVETGARTCHYTFFFTGTIETFVVPPGTLNVIGEKPVSWAPLASFTTVQRPVISALLA